MSEARSGFAIGERLAGPLKVDDTPAGARPGTIGFLPGTAGFLPGTAGVLAGAPPMISPLSK